MHVEIGVALSFLISHLHSKLPRRRAQLFTEALERLLRARYEGHWYPERPLRGSAFRCLHIGGVPDPLLEQAARSSGLDAAEVRENVPQELRVWIDPFEVSYQIGEKGAVRLLTFTTASFAATKFGSTKMKKGGGAGGGGVTVNGAPPQRHGLPRSPVDGNVNNVYANNSRSSAATENPISLSLCSLVGLGGGGASQLSPNAKEFVYPESSTSSSSSSSSSADGALFSFGGEVQFQQPQTSFCLLNSAEGSRGFFLEKTRFVDRMGYSLSPHAAPPYPSQPFQQPVILAN
ncbi:UNVERIFIED_CONTAM: hypothetical protein FKN15_046626 [Acipenser sinensis]